MKKLQIELTDDLMEHIKGVQLLLSHNRGVKVSNSDMVREALAEHYAYGRVRCKIEDATIGAIKSTLPTWRELADKSA